MQIWARELEVSVASPFMVFDVPTARMLREPARVDKIIYSHFTLQSERTKVHIKQSHSDVREMYANITKVWAER